MDDLTKIDPELKEMQQRRIRIDSERQNAEKKITPVRDKLRKTVSQLQDEYHEREKRIITVIERNRDFFSNNHIIRGLFGSFGLKKCNGRVKVNSEEMTEHEIAEKLYKVQRLKKYVRVRYELNRNNIIERTRSGKLDKEITEAGISVQVGLIPFVKPHLPQDINIRKEQEKLEKQNGGKTEE